jgi:hypothetical protein
MHNLPTSHLRQRDVNTTPNDLGLVIHLLTKATQDFHLVRQQYQRQPRFPHLSLSGQSEKCDRQTTPHRPPAAFLKRSVFRFPSSADPFA